MAHYRKKPVVIEAVQFTGTGESCTEVAEFTEQAAQWKSTTYDGGHIPTLEGAMEFGPGDWIIKGVAGEFYPCKPAIFAATYEPAGHDACARCDGKGREPSPTGTPQIGAPSCMLCHGAGERAV
jgi:hypothetical protein